ncbi:MAG: NADH-quinone oxidoreductase subunit A [Phycisphaerae bacterium]|nr:NADH-quinone oxidoreductase subunit A [Phycisphaerae bacterium]
MRAAFVIASLESAAGPYPSDWLPVAMLVLIAVVFAVGTLALSAMVGRSRRGPVKDSPYEAGVVPVGDARRRFHVRYYVIAMVFLLFDVEVVLLFPWAVLFNADRSGFLLAEMFVFLAILAVGYVYAWRKGVLRFD